LEARRVTKMLIAALAATTILTACGGSESDEDKVRSTAEEYASAFSDGDYEKACSLMTSEAKARAAVAGAFGGNKEGGCEGALKGLSGFLDTADKRQLEDYSVKSVTIKGNVAAVRDNTGSPSRLKKKDGEWLVDVEPD
jgi:hypothetical protein